MSPSPTPSPTSSPAATDTRSVDLAIGGMTCASCSSRVERKLNKLDGVEASVNLATEKAHVTYPATLSVADLVTVVEQTGYTATDLTPDARRGGRGEALTETTPEAQVGSGPAYAVDRVMSRASLRTRLEVALPLTVFVVVLAMVPAAHHLLGAARPWAELALTAPVALWAAWPFHRSAAINARHRASTMDTLVSIGVTAAFLWSLVATVVGSTGHMYYEVAAVVTTFLLAGRLAEHRARTAGRSALTTLLELGAKDVAVQRIDPTDRVTREVRIPIEQLAVGEQFVVRPGEKIATDGVVVDGSSAIDRSLVTGESLPVEVAPGGEVTGGTLNTHGRLVVRATRVGSDTTLASITRLVEQAQTGKAPVQRLADRISAVFVPAVLVIATLTFLGWLVAGQGAAAALSAAVSVLVVACPCALGLATPTGLLVGTGRGAELGILIKGPEILESTRRIDTVVLDKTGTITTGTATLVDVTPSGRLTPTAALQAAASVEAGSEHPVALAVVRAARQRGIELKPIRDFTNLPGLGARATIKDTEVTVGRASLFDVVPGDLEGDRVGTTVYVGWGGVAYAALTVADEIRPTSPDSLQALRDLGLRTMLLTGDNKRTARQVAEQVGINPADVIAEVMPADKHAAVARLQEQGRVVAMVGDGVNDAAALAQADLGMAMGTGSDVAIDSADIVLVRPEIGAVADAIALSRRTLRIIQQNLAWAFGYNLVAIPLAVLGALDPMVSGAAMALSSVLVVTNSLRLRAFGRSRASGRA
ncbi:heavy metal translocating P-type ATPase [Arsenicicoccus sp. oral taxon 190]|uniref:heavy metal translocating P-type ATPase n=1 Tax=Arsenicicoccus sp. oral taxon 190 TaxID=1658671 RepID=UPI00067A1B9B|nr:heavy metal translocating P-type ATPase [Arsenicicoccus sp. oral taxon 190]AKT52567.1 carbonate dehydratase [Arsenicicoccus sp. oral taxon 190]